MEPAGLAIGIAGLVGVFSACLECFELVQLGRQFARDYGNCLLKLDAAKLQLSRWGAAVKLEQGPNSEPQFSASEEEKRLARRLMEQILESFEDAERISERYKRYDSTGAQEPNMDVASDLSLDRRRLHLTMRELAQKRQKSTSIRKKTTWVLYEKKRFDRLIEDVTGFINQLVQLFPAAQKEQTALCTTEVSTINQTHDLVLLSETVGKDDEILSAVIEKEVQNRGHRVTDWKATGSAKVWAGDENGPGVDGKSHDFARFTVSDNAVVHLGNINRGKSKEGLSYEQALDQTREAFD